MLIEKDWLGLKEKNKTVLKENWPTLKKDWSVLQGKLQIRHKSGQQILLITIINPKLPQEMDCIVIAVCDCPLTKDATQNPK